MNLKKELDELKLRLYSLERQVYGTEFKEPEMILFKNCEVPFYIGKYPVTQALWEHIMGEDNNPSRFEGRSCPVENVSYYDALKFIGRLNKLTNKTYRLPTEYEWILAASVDNTIYSGSDDLDMVGWYSENSNSHTLPVGLLKPNKLGIYDMSGNVWEWCQDNRHGNYKDDPSDRRVIRGGSWINYPSYCRVVIHLRYVASLRRDFIGFRLAMNGE